MPLKEKLQEDLKQAMRAKERLRIDTIRSVRAAVLNKEVETGGEIDDAAITQLIKTLCKQREDAIEQYEQGGRNDLAEAERKEKEILESYLPAAPDAATIENVVSTVVAELGASGMQDMGRVMKEALQRLGPAADGKRVSAAVRAKLK